MSPPRKQQGVLALCRGPGCSSLYGLFEELGPYRPKVGTNGSELVEFDYAWTKIANIIFLDAPGGVGYSRPASNGFPAGSVPRKRSLSLSLSLPLSLCVYVCVCVCVSVRLPVPLLSGY